MAVALYVVGFAETVRDLMTRYGTKIVDPTNDIRIIGIAALILLFLVTLIGLEWVVYTQVFLLIILIAAIISVLIGSFYPSPLTSRDQLKAYGIFDYSTKLFKENFTPKYRGNNNFFSMFSIFFPAATGILAGANLSGDLKNPSYAVPKGTLVAIGVTSVSYVIMCWIIGATLSRDASGIIMNATLAINATCIPGECKFGMMNDFQVSIDLLIAIILIIDLII